MKKYRGVLFATIFMLGASSLFWLLGGTFVFVAGVSFITSGMLLGFYWVEVLFGKRTYEDEELHEYRRIHLPVFFEGLGLGILDYLILKVIFHSISDLLTGLVMILPAFIGTYTVRGIYLSIPDEELAKRLTLEKELLLTFFANLGFMGIVVGFKLITS